jgi:hypothetical protein
MTVKHKWVDIASALSKVFEKDLQVVARLESETGQVLVWLVGLGSSLLAIAVVQPERVESLLGRSFGLYTTLLLVTVASGVTGRLLGLLTSGYTANHLTTLAGNLWGYSAGYSLEEPAELSDRWDEAEIVERLKSEFGRDYRFLLERNAPLDFCREAYQKQRELWYEEEEKGERYIKDLIATHLGLTDGEVARYWEATDPVAFTKLRRRAFVVRGLRILGLLLFLLSSATFLVAISLLALAL